MMLADTKSIETLGEERREKFRNDRRVNSLRVLKPEDPAELEDILYMQEDTRCGN